MKILKKTMAHNNTEIEIKIPLEQEQFETIQKRLQQEATFLKTSEQKDTYLNPPHKNFLESEYPFEWLSIRQRAGKTILNYKHFHPEEAEEKTHCDEYETEIQKTEHLEKTFTALGFTEIVSVKKHRETYLYKDAFEIALDTVQEAGYFIEIEALKDFGSVEQTRIELFALAQQLHLDIDTTEHRGYPQILMQKKGLLKKDLS